MKTTRNITLARLLPAVGFLSVALLLSPRAHAQTTTFSDDFDYTGWNTGADLMNTVWTEVSNGTNAPKIAAATDTLPVRMTIANSAVYASFGQTITTDWTLTVQMLPSTSASNPNGWGLSSMWVALLNADGSAGAGFIWASGNANQNNGQGYVQLFTMSPTTAGQVGWKYNDSNNGTTLVGSSHASGVTLDPNTPYSSSTAANTDGFITSPMATLTLSWSAETSTLTLSVNGVVKSSYVDTSLTSFSQIYLGGGDTTQFADLTLTVPSAIPEPSTMSLFLGLAAGLGVVVIAVRRRFMRTE